MVTTVQVPHINVLTYTSVQLSTTVSQTAMAGRRKTGRDGVDFSFVAVHRPRRGSGSLKSRFPPLGGVATAFNGGPEFVNT